MVKYFKTEKDQYVFAFVVMDGENRSKYLGITQNHYYNKDLATEWRDNILRVLNNDNIKTDFTEEQVSIAKERLDIFYEHMIED